MSTSKFPTLSGRDMNIDDSLIEPFHFLEMIKSHYVLSDGFCIKGFLPREQVDDPEHNRSAAQEFFRQVSTTNQLMYDASTFEKLLAHTDTILKHPEYFLLRLPALFINHEIKKECTTFTLGSLLESWRYKSDLHCANGDGEILLMSMLHPSLGDYQFRVWSSEKKEFTEIGIHGFTKHITDEFEQLNQRYPVQLKENDKYAQKLLDDLNDEHEQMP